MKAKEIVLKSIGYVQTDFGEEEIKNQPEETISILIINPKLVSALDGIESYSHLIVIYYMHKVPSSDNKVKISMVTMASTTSNYIINNTNLDNIKQTIESGKKDKLTLKVPL